ncbi:hypothetical protein BABINDRAFT_167244 [Babjeviella inositovora NRRL Y-12698]|uniref:Uncharacterized protein n=1 Tax=Babjeviella inositovora NRRL Y-12698 TaxID=984486 RepID=A0A1E3QP08_9ASCO|nr:uncharacterized protein BABINDRAFT_167244 [Babjeviella inositovora NRRL Y-12698]ODQ79380.1 hypothetical protein BABINDRAFT_167244 [Babjeviella inositovora NRRL Y-12698]
MQSGGNSSRREELLKLLRTGDSLLLSQTDCLRDQEFKNDIQNDLEAKARFLAQAAENVTNLSSGQERSLQDLQDATYDDLKRLVKGYSEAAARIPYTPERSDAYLMNSSKIDIMLSDHLVQSARLISETDAELMRLEEKVESEKHISHSLESLERELRSGIRGLQTESTIQDTTDKIDDLVSKEKQRETKLMKYLKVLVSSYLNASQGTLSKSSLLESLQLIESLLNNMTSSHTGNEVQDLPIDPSELVLNKLLLQLLKGELIKVVSPDSISNDGTAWLRLRGYGLPSVDNMEK